MFMMVYFVVLENDVVEYVSCSVCLFWLCLNNDVVWIMNLGLVLSLYVI